jgi:arginine utilization protein RocB
VRKNVMKSELEEKERFFSVELKSKANLKNVTMMDGTRGSVLVEGTIGKLVQASFVEGVILEIVGKKGILRINLQEKELKKTASENLNVDREKHGTREAQEVS